jgi:hypothetical protein
MEQVVDKEHWLGEGFARFTHLIGLPLLAKCPIEVVVD